MTTLMASVALTLILIEMAVRRVDAARERRIRKLGNLDAYEVFTTRLREIEKRCDALEVRLRDQELRP